MSGSTPRSVVSVCDWLPPDFGAVGQYALQEAQRMATAGASVTLLGLSSSAGSREAGETGKGSLRVVRLHARLYERSNFLRRAAWTNWTNTRLLWRTIRLSRGASEILFTGSPPLFLHWIVPANLFLRKRLRYRITDFHPECLIAELGSGSWLSRPLRLLQRWTNFLRRRVDRFEVLGEDQRRRLLEIGIAPERIELRRDESPVRIGESTLPLPLPVELAGRTVLLYSGNFGVAHDDATFLAGYEHHHREGSGEVVLWLNATGAKADRLESELRTRALPVYRSRPVPLEDLARLLVTPHAHLITLRDEFVGYVLPSKVYGCIASGKPVLFVGSDVSDVDLLCRERIPERYRRVAVGDGAGFAARLEELASGAGHFTGG